MRRPPAVAAFASARHAPMFVRLFVGLDWRARLDAASEELRLYGEVAPALALPPGDDPAFYRWPVAGRNVAIYGTLSVPRLRRLLAALLRDGAVAAAGLDEARGVHVAALPAAEEAA